MELPKLQLGRKVELGWCNPRAWLLLPLPLLLLLLRQWPLLLLLLLLLLLSLPLMAIRRLASRWPGHASAAPLP